MFCASPMMSFSPIIVPPLTPLTHLHRRACHFFRLRGMLATHPCSGFPFDSASSPNPSVSPRDFLPPFAYLKRRKTSQPSRLFLLFPRLLAHLLFFSYFFSLHPSLDGGPVVVYPPKYSPFFFYGARFFLRFFSCPTDVPPLGSTVAILLLFSPSSFFSLFIFEVFVIFRVPPALPFQLQCVTIFSGKNFFFHTLLCFFP